MIDIDLYAYRKSILTKQDGETTLIFGKVRKQWLLLTPEELVRQLFIEYCDQTSKYPLARISVERQIKVLGLTRRYDIAIHDKKGAPEILIECKAPYVTLNQSVLDQIASYNVAMQVPYLIVTNGIETYGFEIDIKEGTFKRLSALPY